MHCCIVAGLPPAIHQAQPLICTLQVRGLGHAAFPCSFWERPSTLDFLAPSINYSSCRDVVQLYSVRHSGDMARIRDTAPVICRGFVIFEVHAKRPKGAAPLSPCSRFITVSSASIRSLMAAGVTKPLQFDARLWQRKITSRVYNHALYHARDNGGRGLLLQKDFPRDQKDCDAQTLHIFPMVQPESRE